MLSNFSVGGVTKLAVDPAGDRIFATIFPSTLRAYTLSAPHNFVNGWDSAGAGCLDVAADGSLWTADNGYYSGSDEVVRWNVSTGSILQRFPTAHEPVVSAGASLAGEG